MISEMIEKFMEESRGSEVATLQPRTRATSHDLRCLGVVVDGNREVVLAFGNAWKSLERLSGFGSLVAG